MLWPAYPDMFIIDRYDREVSTEWHLSQLHEEVESTFHRPAHASSLPARGRLISGTCCPSLLIFQFFSHMPLLASRAE